VISSGSVHFPKTWCPMSGKLKLKPGAPGRDEPGTDALESDERTATLEHLGIVAPAGDGAITPLGALLVERGDLSGQQLRDALGAQTSGGKRLGEILVELGVISERVLSSALAEQVGLEAIDLSRARPDIAIVGLMPEDEARALGALSLRKVGERIEVAIADPLDRELQSKLIALLHAPVRLLVAPLADINYAIDRAYLNLAEISGALREFEQRSEARGRITGTTAEVAVDANAPIVKVVNLIFEQAVRDRGSDVHIEPQQDRVRVRVRTDGALHEVLSLPVSMATALVSRIKVMADMNIVERRRPQDGQIEITVDGHNLDVRVSTTATVFGEKCVLRLLDRTRALLTLAQLGMSSETYTAAIASTTRAGPTERVAPNAIPPSSVRLRHRSRARRSRPGSRSSIGRSPSRAPATRDRRSTPSMRSSCISRCSNRTGSTNGFGWNRSEKGDAVAESRDRHHVGHLARRRGRRSSRGVTGPSRGGPGHPIPRA
jgi:Type II/IV secretion system protein/Type II secretion system (T2SS), protein E, N-terminal domain